MELARRLGMMIRNDQPGYEVYTRRLMGWEMVHAEVNRFEL